MTTTIVVTRCTVRCVVTTADMTAIAWVVACIVTILKRNTMKAIAEAMRVVTKTMIVTCRSMKSSTSDTATACDNQKGRGWSIPILANF